MNFSATGHLLPGSMQRPDTVTLEVLEQDFLEIHITTGSTNYRLNNLDNIRVDNTITGLRRVLLGIAQLISSISSQNNYPQFAEGKRIAKNIGRGLIETIPVIGTIIKSHS